MKFGASTTAAEAIAGQDLSGRTAVVTGGNSGIGVETVRVLASAGCKVVLASHSLRAGKDVAQQLAQEGVKGEVLVLQLDLADLVSVKRFAVKVVAAIEGPDLLVLNAGIMACPFFKTADGFEGQIGTNHHGHAYLTSLLLPRMQALGCDRQARVVAVSSVAHQFSTLDVDNLHYDKGRAYWRWNAYGSSKMANILYAKELARRCEGTNMTAFSVHPGVIMTNLSRHMFGKQSLGKTISTVLSRPFLKTVSQGAATTIVACTQPHLPPGAYLADCQVAKPRVPAGSAQLAEKLWDVTEMQIKAALARRASEAAAQLKEAQAALAVLKT